LGKTNISTCIGLCDPSGLQACDIYMWTDCVCALGALAAKHAGDRRLLYHYLAQSKRRLLHLFPIYAFFYQKLVALINVN